MLNWAKPFTHFLVVLPLVAECIHMPRKHYKFTTYSVTNTTKKLETLIDVHFDLVVTVCDHASQTCPIFPGMTEIVHLGFEDPNGGDYQAFELCFNQIKARLLPYVRSALT
jgi:protein-tyrosine-phosphatase